MTIQTNAPEHHTLTYSHIADVIYDGIQFSCYGDIYKDEAIVYQVNFKGLPFDGSHFISVATFNILQELVNDLGLSADEINRQIEKD